MLDFSYNPLLILSQLHWESILNHEWWSIKKSFFDIALQNGISAIEINGFWYGGASDEMVSAVINWEALHMEFF